MLIDTSGFLCKFEREEVCHEKAVELYDSATVRYTTNYVLAEYTALAQARGIPRKQIIEFSEHVLGEEKLEIIWIDKALHTLAVELLKRREDKTYSLCDAASFLVMRNLGITEALTTDRHFKQEGFVRMLEP